MTTTHRMATTHGANRRWTKLGVWALTGMFIGAAPGALLVLLAEFVVDGEMQLTVGAPGLLLAAIGATAGLFVGALRARRGGAGQHGR